jgi:hypothetical protein
MSALFSPAVKEQLKARVAIDGPTGSGKTWTALQWARILAGKDGAVGVVDTENRSAAYYAPSPGDEPDRLQWWDPPYEFGHMPWQPPYDPRKLAQVIQSAGDELGDDGVLVIDSFTHFWNGEGGTLDVVDAASARSGNSFTGWKAGTPAQRHLIDTIIHAPFHVICTMRSKMEYVLEEQVKNGKKIQVPKKIGMQPEQRAGVEYEFTVVADMDLEHRLVVSKSRCSLIADVVVDAGRSHEPAEMFAGWLSSGVERASAASVKALTDRMDAIDDEDVRRGVKVAFAGEFGKPTELLSDKVAAAGAWLDERLSRLDAEIVEPGADSPQGTP